MNKIFLLDAYALIFRAYYAFINRPIVNSKGLNTSAIYGFVNALDEILRNQKPSHIAVVFDPSGPTFRNEMYPEYKANREATPEDIRKAVPYIKQIIEAFHIPCITVDGFEADDVIGTLAKQFVSSDNEVFMMTPDKDYGQLIEDNIKMYKPGRSGNPPEIIDVKGLKEKYGLEKPAQIIDMLALMGDSSDNIPGVMGIGEKTAVKLINQFGDVDTLLKSIDQLKGKQKERIIEGKEQLLLSRKLVTIDINVPHEYNLDQLIVEDKDIDVLSDLFDELEFRTIKKRILGEANETVAEAPKTENAEQGSLFASAEIEQKSFKTIKDVETNYVLVDSEESMQQMLAELKTASAFCFDTETTGIDVITAELVGIAFSCEKGSGYYVPFNSNYNLNDHKKKELQILFEAEDKIKIGHNCKYDIQILLQAGISVKPPFYDTMIAHYLLEPDKKHKMDILAENYLNYSPIPIENLIGKKGKNQASMKNIPVEQVVDYATEDADITLQLYHLFEPQIKEKGLDDLLRKVEMPLMEVLAQVELDGVSIDSESLHEYGKVLNNELINLENSIYKHAGLNFNINSPKQLGEILFSHLKIDNAAKKTKTKQFSTNEETLLKLVDKHPIVQDILDYRGVKKLLSTYVEALPKLVKKETGKIHTSFNQTIAATGRLSSTSPNLQNIPIRTERGKELRKAFIASSNDRVLLAADYSQIELRLMAHLSKDAHMIEAFQNNEDIHTATAAKIYKLNLADVTREMRSKAKTANFGIIYGISAFGLAQRLNIPRSEAKELIDGYFENFPAVKEFMDEQVKLAREKEYVETILGRRRYLPDINSRNGVVRGFAERNAINAPIQGSAADIIKIAMINIFRRIHGKYKSAMILQVHDELVFDAYKTEVDALSEIIKEEMESAYKLDVPLTIDMNSGENWLEAH
jgi:DNA polymerase-1